MNPVRTRIAPSPTGENLHIGNAYTALINYVFARKGGGQFLIRIEDTDRTRLVSGSEERILESLSWLGIAHDEGPDVGGPYAPYRQSDRLPVYRKSAEELVSKGVAYHCFCTPARLEEMRKKQADNKMPPMYDGLCKLLSPDEIKKKLTSGTPGVIRLKVPDSGTTAFRDTIRGEISFENALLDDQVILKSDGYPTYHLGVVVDDHLMGITHVIRGEEWISSTPKHILLYDAFGWEKPVYAHMPLLRNPDKSKLSKRKNPVWVSWYREKGFLPEAVRNYLATLAWAHPEGRDVFTTEEMIKVFELSSVKTTAPIFDNEKLRWMNGEYIRAMTDYELAALIRSFDRQIDAEATKLLDRIIPLIRDRMKLLSEFRSLAGFFFERPSEFEKIIPPEKKLLLRNALSECPWTHDGMEKSLRDMSVSANLKPKDVFMALRILITGKSVGPPLLESLEILGREEALARLA